MPRLFFFLLFLKAFACFAQRNDTIRIEKDPLVITQKVYVLDEKKTKNLQAVTLQLMPQWLHSNSKQENIQLSRGKGLSLRVLYEKERAPLRIGVGLGMGMISHMYTQTLAQNVFSDITVTFTDTLEKYYKLKGSDTLWYYVTEERPEKRTVEQIQNYTSAQRVHWFFAELPINLSVFHPFGNWELGVGAEASVRKNFGNVLLFRSWNLVGSLFGSLGYRFSEKFVVNISPRYGKDLTAFSDQFQNNYWQLALSSSFFW